MCLRETILYFLLIEVAHAFVNCGQLEGIPSTSDCDLITDLPGLLSPPKFKQYSGYLQGSTDNYQLHYWFVETESGNGDDPLVLWLNGGPGCSSLEGLLTENGPFKLNKAGQLDYNPHSWNKIANVLYLEAPAGVGFSYAKDGNVTSDDNLTALNNYHALLNFLEKFPVYKGNDFFITGESYAGIYVPTLALHVLSNTSNGLNLKGIAVGNAVVSEKLHKNSLVYYVKYHGMMDEDTWNDLFTECCESKCENKCMFTEGKSPECTKVMEKIDSLISGFDIFNLYKECTRGVDNTFGNLTMSGSPVEEKQTEMESLKNTTEIENSLFVEIFPCLDDTLTHNYLNKPEVQKALHVDLDKLPRWIICNGEVSKNYGQLYEDLSEVYLQVLQQKTPVMLFAGNIDMAVNYLGILWFVNDLGLKVKKPMENWYYIDVDGTKQVGGVHKTLALNDTLLQYVTVHGAGHMVPKDKPVSAYHFFKSFIQAGTL